MSTVSIVGAQTLRSKPVALDLTFIVIGVAMAMNSAPLAASAWIGVVFYSSLNLFENYFRERND